MGFIIQGVPGSYFIWGVMGLRFPCVEACALSKPHWIEGLRLSIVNLRMDS